MDSAQRNIEEYILGNFSVLPADVLNSLLASLDPQSLLSICTTNKAFSAFCSSKLGRKALDRASIQYIAQEAPLSKPIRSLGEQASLIRKGFTTIYNMEYTIKYGVFLLENLGGNDVVPAKFGYKEGSRGHFHFDIKGFPPAEGTQVWVVVSVDGYYEYQSQDQRSNKVLPEGVYVDIEDVWREYGHDETMLAPHEDQSWARALQDGRLGLNRFVFAVSLP